MSVPLKSQHSSGFTLVELLVVIGVISLMMMLAAPAFRSISGSKGLVQAMNTTTSYLELARSEAQTRQTYTWVAFGSTANTNSSGNYEFCIAVAASTDNIAYGGNKPNFLTRVQRFENIKLSTWQAGYGVNIAQGNVAIYPALSYGVVNPVIFSTVVTFTPDGQVLLIGASNGISSTIPYVPLANVVLESYHGTNTPIERGVIDIYGGTGAIRQEGFTPLGSQY
ncbi:MAG: prepilin-type N-terminal cleavage/methylation domain-containing protein [Chthoniobacterales bacterium]